MLEAVRDFRETTGQMIGVKPAGGIRTSKDAIKYLVMVNEVAGPDWLDPDWFRFGASTLLNDLLMQRTKMPPAATPAPTTSPWTGAVSTSEFRASSTQRERFEYAPAPESRSVVDIKSSYGLFINGEFIDGGGKSFKTISPSTEEVLSEVAEADEKDVDKAVKAARRAYSRVWSKMSGAERGKYLFRIARIIQERAREIAVLESIDNGKPIKESRDVDIPNAAAWFFYYAGWADKLEYACRLSGPDPQPLGVAGQVIPWNFPFLMLAWKIAPALAAGNTVVLKPAETTPLTALLFAEICQQADLPPGRGEHPHRRRRHRARDRLPRGRGQGRVHRLHRRGPRRSPRRSPGRGRR